MSFNAPGPLAVIDCKTFVPPVNIFFISFFSLSPSHNCFHFAVSS